MLFNRTVDYTVEQAVALLSGKISLQALSSNSKSVQRYCANMFSSRDFWQSSAVNRYYQQITNGLWQGELRAVDDQVLVKVPSSDDQHHARPVRQEELTDDYELSRQTRISKAELRRWVAGNGEAHSFLMNPQELSIARSDSWEAGKQAFLEAEGFGNVGVKTTTTVTATAAPTGTAEKAGLDDIQALLSGTHPCQNEALRAALQEWLNSVDESKKAGQVPTEGSKSNGGASPEMAA